MSVADREPELETMGITLEETATIDDEVVWAASLDDIDGRAFGASPTEALRGLADVLDAVSGGGE